MLPKDISVSSPAGTPHLSPMGSSGCSWQSSGQRHPSTLAPGDGNWVTSGGVDLDLEILGYLDGLGGAANLTFKLAIFLLRVIH